MVVPGSNLDGHDDAQTMEDSFPGKTSGENLTHEAMDSESSGAAPPTVANMTSRVERVGL